MAAAIGRLLEEINVYTIISLFWCKKEINFTGYGYSVGFVKQKEYFLRNFQKCVPPKMVFSQK